MYYLWINNGKIDGKSDLLQDAVFTDTRFQVEVSEEVYNDTERFIWDGAKVVLNPNYEEEQAQKERERVGNLRVTKRVFALALQELGITYMRLKELVSTNEQAQLEWDLCVELQRNNPLLDSMASHLGISSETLDVIFKKANGEDA